MQTTTNFTRVPYFVASLDFRELSNALPVIGSLPLFPSGIIMSAYELF